MKTSPHDEVAVQAAFEHSGSNGGGSGVRAALSGLPMQAGPLAGVRNWLAPRSGPAFSFDVSTTSVAACRA